MPPKNFNLNHQEILIEDALCVEYDLQNVSDEDFAKFVLMGGGLDVYCVKCESKSVLK